MNGVVGMSNGRPSEMMGREDRKALRDLGWSVHRKKSRRPWGFLRHQLVPIESGEDELIDVEAQA